VRSQNLVVFSLVIPGRMKAAKPLQCEPGIPDCFALNMSGFRVRSRRLWRRSHPGM